MLQEENAEQKFVKREDGIEDAVKYTEEDDDGDPLESFEKSQGDLRIASPPLKKPKKLAYEFAQASSSSKITPVSYFIWSRYYYQKICHTTFDTVSLTTCKQYS